MRKQALFLWTLLVGLTACQSVHDSEKKLFSLMESEYTGIHFSNDLQEGRDFNILIYLYYYNGGGVAAGDINNDGLPDLYFTANELPNKLYLNQGNFQFKDITEEAGVAGQPGWTTGVTMADVNGDGWLDLYVSQLGNYEGITGYNQLYINSGDTAQGYPVFREEASTYGLDEQSFATQAAFFDYDLDGDLDAYLLNHTVHSTDTYVRAEQGRKRSPLGDKLMRNDDGHFVDVSEETGIYGSTVGYGLSVSIADLNSDGYPDIYVGNDFHENDYLYYNQGDGTFAESLEKAVGHTSRFSMGNDIGDFNNDGRVDIAVLDMKPEDEAVLKTSAGEDPYDIYQYKLRYGYNHQYARNTLQLNVGDSLYSEIGQFSGIAATDWSWSALWADLDLDGWKDLFITNGIYRRPNNLDFIKFISTADAQQAIKEKKADYTKMISKMPSEAVPNRAYQNLSGQEGHAYRFADKAEAWGLDQAGFSNGAAYVDLDNDGDLDLVTNNIGAEAFIYRNNTRETSPHHYLKVKLQGQEKNTYGLGAKVSIFVADSMQYQEMMTTRGFESSVEPVLTFGLGQHTKVDSVVVVWPGSTSQTLTQVPSDQTLTLKQTEASLQHHDYQAKNGKQVFQSDIQSPTLFHHRENNFTDFNREGLMPHMLSREGPALAIGDVNDDGRDDFYVGGARGQGGAIFLQQANGTFIQGDSTCWKNSRGYEDVASVFFDPDGDGDLDLYVGSAGNELANQGLEDRLYLNDGQGRFTQSDGLLPELYGNTSCVKATDFDGDGDVDLFVGSRVVTGSYGASPESYLLENDGSGHFRDVTHQKAALLATLGMITDAVWVDVNQDGREDLMVVGEWIAPTLLVNQGNRLQKAETGLGHYTGWWNTIAAADLDQDGDVDFVLGNLGQNSVIQANHQEPARLYTQDFDQNGSLDQVLTFYKGGVSYPFATRDELVGQLVPLKKNFTRYDDFAGTTIDHIFSQEQLDKAQTLQAETFASVMLENADDGTFEVKALPPEAQFSPVRAIVVEDLDGDGQDDLLLGGNFYAVGPKQGRYDASYGTFLKGKGNLEFQLVSPDQSGLKLTGEVRHLQTIQTENGKYLLVAKNNAPIQLIPLNNPSL